MSPGLAFYLGIIVVLAMVGGVVAAMAFRAAGTARDEREEKE